MNESLDHTSSNAHDGPDLDAELDELLGRAAAPTTVMNAHVAAEIAAMERAARDHVLHDETGRNATQPVSERKSLTSERKSRRSSRSGSRAAAAGIIAGVLMLGSGVAAAATFHEWSPWVQDPDGVLTYSLPSGAVCEHRIGDFETEGPEISEAVRDWFSTVDVESMLDIDAAIAASRADVHTFVREDGSSEPSGFGTEHYSADREYSAAVTSALNAAMQRELNRRGIYTGEMGSWSGEVSCPGAKW